MYGCISMISLSPCLRFSNFFVLFFPLFLSLLFDSAMCSRLSVGVPETWQFAIGCRENLASDDAAGICTIAFDMRKSMFSVAANGSGDLSTAKQLPFNRNQLTKIVGSTKWLGLAAIDNSQFIVALLFELKTRRYFLVSLRIDGEQITVAEEHYLRLERIVELTSANLIKDENGNSFVAISWQIGGVRPKTLLTLLRVTVNKVTGTIATRTALNETVDGKWFRPLVFDRTLILRQGMQHVVRVPLQFSTSMIDSSNIDRRPIVSATSAIGATPAPHCAVFGAATFNNSALHYIFDGESNTGRVWALNLKTFIWRSTAITLTRHALSRFVSLVVVGERLYMHGDCALVTCKARAHVHCVPLKGMIP